jgi:hypothetical protein
MPNKKIEIIQEGNRFTMQLIEGERRSVLASDQTGAALDYSWWLNPIIFDLAQTLRDWNCSDAQIRQAYEHLLSGRPTHLKFDLPPDR